MEKILARYTSQRCILRLPGADTDETMSRILDEKSGLTPNIAVPLQAGYDLEREDG